MSISHDFARAAGSWHWGDLPPALQRRLCLRIADIVGLIGAARQTPPGRAVRRAVQGEPGAAPVLFEAATLQPTSAALLHGTLAHVADHDDTLPDSVIHPSSVILPTAFAAAPPGASGQQILTAALAGYELLARLGRVAGRDLHRRGFQATSVLGPLGAALTACQVRGEAPSTTVAALGLAGSMSGGLLAFLADGTWSKRRHPGWAAQSGIRAADLAGAGFTGPEAVIEGRHGVFDAFLERAIEPADVLAGLGEVWESQGTEWKFLPCAHVIHPFARLGQHLREEHDLAPEDVVEARTHVAPWYVPIVCEPRDEKIAPIGEYQARASLPYVLAVVLAGLPVTPAAFDDDTRGRQDLRELAERVVHVEDPDLDAGFGARLTLTLADGRRLTATPYQLPDEPEEDRLRSKLSSNLELAGRPELTAAVWEASLGLTTEGLPRLIELTR
jgi:2-methylcitrate dehydratase PrpD